MPIRQTEPVEVRYYPCDGSVFLDTHHLIKGVAGSLFWKLAREHVRHQRCEYSTRELRLPGHQPVLDKPGGWHCVHCRLNHG
ncbi:MAG: hypothetical protein U1D36_22675, partial [Hydrogenophaga sp.]|nr:hypothetical protein [Hydrogenophaga sp.]